jgi:predicted DNA-binding WGR domain protein
MAYFTRSEPAKNLHRFYVVQLAPTLFGSWMLLREWGRSGSPGTVRVTSFAQYDDAEQAARQIIKRRLQHGYSEASPFCSPSQSVPQTQRPYDPMMARRNARSSETFHERA